MIASIWLAQNNPVSLFSDYLEYYQLGMGLLEQQQFGLREPSAYRLPGFPFLLAALMVISKSVTWLSVCNVILSSLLPVMVFNIVRTVAKDTTAAWAAGGPTALYPVFCFYAPILATEHLFLLLLLGAVCVMVTWPMRPLWRALIAGILLGGAALTRGDGLFYLPALAVIAAAMVECWGKRLLNVAVLALACGLVLLPWYLRNVGHFGSDVGLSSAAGANFYFAHNDRQYGWHRLPNEQFHGLSRAEQNRLGYEIGRARLQRKPASLFEDIKLGTMHLLIDAADYAIFAALVFPDPPPGRSPPRHPYPAGSRGLVRVAYSSVALLGVLSLLFVRRFPWRAYFIPFAFITMNWICYAVVFWGKPRFRQVSEVALCVLAGLAIAGVVAAVRSRSRRA